MSRAGFAHAFLLTYFTGGAGNFGDGFGTCPGVSFASFFIALIDYAAVEDVDSYGVEAEGGGGEMEGANGCVGGGEGVDGDVETVGEGNGEAGLGDGGEVVEETI